MWIQFGGVIISKKNDIKFFRNMVVMKNCAFFAVNFFDIHHFLIEFLNKLLPTKKVIHSLLKLDNLFFFKRLPSYLKREVS